MNRADPEQHLGDEAIAAAAGGQNAGPAALEHLSVCSDCRRRVSAVSHLLEDPGIAVEISNIDPTRTSVRRRWLASAATLAAVAAVAAIMVAAPERMRNSAAPSDTATDVRREGIITTTVPPRILSPTDIAKPGELLRWTSTSGADLYRVRVWNTEGTVVFSSDTPDTTMTLPSELERPGTVYLWEVKARTGWDRWVSSDFLQFRIAPAIR